jgi:hypothetical protein
VGGDPATVAHHTLCGLLALPSGGLHLRHAASAQPHTSTLTGSLERDSNLAHGRGADSTGQLRAEIRESRRVAPIASRLTHPHVQSGRSTDPPRSRSLAQHASGRPASANVRETGANLAPIAPRLQRARRRENRSLPGDSRMARPGLEPGTPRFSVVVSCFSSSRILQRIPRDLRRFGLVCLSRILRAFPSVTADGGPCRPFRGDRVEADLQPAGD